MEEASIVQSLQHKLVDLEHKVQAFRHELAAEFLRYYQHMLRDVPPAAAANIQQSLVQSLSAYPNLSLDLRLPDSRMSSTPGSVHHHRSPQPAIVSDTSGSSAPDAPDSPHDREKEFQGLFTPSYLPLLESAPELTRSPPPPPPPQTTASSMKSSPPGSSASPQTQQSLDALLLPEPRVALPGQGTDMVHRLDTDVLHNLVPSISPSLSPSPSRPGHIRQHTNETNSSVCSERSDSKAPRSALRRSSNSSKPPQSPRRVRFEFAGAEVLPSASPQPSEFIAPRPPVSAEPPSTSTTDLLLDDDEDDEELPPPRKTSSSEALRALSREPLEEGTVWTVVNSNQDEILVEQDDVGSATLTPSSADRSQPTQAAPEPLAPQASENIRRQQLLGSLAEQPEDDVENSDSSSDEDFLAMAKPKSFNNKQTIQSTSASLKMANPARTQAAKSTDRPDSKPELDKKTHVEDETGQILSDDTDADDEDMFHFESGGLSPAPRPKPRPLPIEEESEEEEEEEKALSSNDTSEPNQGIYATSPAVPITRSSVSSGPTTPTAAKFNIGSLGSYKGRPVTMPVVRNPEVHARAASLGQFNTFVGGLDGRSGMDEGDLSSFRASFANTGFSGTPRSLTERMMMEEAHLERRGGSKLPQ